jgi:hypothetical protein
MIQALSLVERSRLEWTLRHEDQTNPDPLIISMLASFPENKTKPALLKQST